MYWLIWAYTAPNQRQQNWPFVFGKHESNQTFSRESCYAPVCLCSSTCWSDALLEAGAATHLAQIQSFVWLLSLPRNTSPQPVKWSPDGDLISVSFSLSTLLSPPLSLHATFFLSSPPILTFFTVLWPTSLHFHSLTSSFSNSIVLSGSCCSLPVLNWCCSPESG